MVIEVKICMTLGSRQNTYNGTFDTVKGHVIADLASEISNSQGKRANFTDYMIMPSGTIVPLRMHKDDDENSEDCIFAVASEEDEDE